MSQRSEDVTEQDQGVKISLREIYDTLQEVSVDIKNLGARMDYFEKEAEKIAQMREELNTTRETANEALSRVVTLEKDRAKNDWITKAILGTVITVVVTAVLGFMLTAIVNTLRIELQRPVKIDGNTQIEQQHDDKADLRPHLSYLKEVKAYDRNN